MAQLVIKKTVVAQWDVVTKDLNGANLTTAPKYNVYLTGQSGNSLLGSTGDSVYSVTFPTAGNYTIKVTAFLTAPDGITKVESTPDVLDVTVFFAPAVPTNLRIS